MIENGIEKRRFNEPPYPANSNMWIKRHRKRLFPQMNDWLKQGGF